MREERTEMTMAADETSGGRRSSRKKTGMLAALLALLLLLSGTFAWFYTADAINEFGGSRGGANSAVLHDDFDEAGVDGVHNKDIYAENTGSEEIYVRIRLYEYMEIDEVSLIAGTKKMDETTWKPHTPDGTDIGGSITFKDYWEWQMGGMAVEYFANSAGKSGVISRYDSTGNDTLVPGASGNKWTHKGQGTSSQVMTMTAYTALSSADKAAFEGWIMDSDGYCYWYEKLAPEAATGLLLDEVSLVGTIPDGATYYYAINVVLETVDEEDLEAWLNGTVTKDGLHTPDKVGSQAMADYLEALSESSRNPDDSEAAKQHVAETAVGDTVIIGKEEWIVLSKKDGKAELLRAELLPEAMQYHNETDDWSWKSSDIYKYLNGDYLKSLSGEVTDILVETTHDTNDPGTTIENTADPGSTEKVYLLSLEEYNAYRSAGVIDGSVSTTGVSGLSNSKWWLRTPRTNNSVNAYNVYAADGEIDYNSVPYYYGIRPALTVSYK